MEFGLFYLIPLAAGQDPRQRYQDTIEQIVLADELGFDVVWLGEQHLRADNSLMSAPMLVAAAAAARTRRIRIGIAVTLLPLHNPLRLAEEAATVDVLSGGRLEYGVGRGIYRQYFRAFDVSYEERTERFAEGLEVLQRAWAEGPFSYEGRFYRYQNLNVVPKPIQRPSPPLRMAAQNDASFDFAAQRGLPVMTAIVTAKRAMLMEQTARYKRIRAEAPGTAAATNIALQVPVYVAQSKAQARADAEESFLRQRGTLRGTVLDDYLAAGGDLDAVPPGTTKTIIDNYPLTFEDLMTDRYAVGDPDEVTARIKALCRDYHAGHVICWFNAGGLIPFEKVAASMRLFMETVRPRFA